MIVKIAEMVEPDIWEPPYLIEALKNLSHYTDDYNFIISRTNSYEELSIFKKEIVTGKKNILILLSDELGIQNWKDGPYFMKNDLYCIFRTYNNNSLVDHDFIYPIPCGFSCGVGVHSNDGQKYLNRDFEFSNKKLSDRTIDIFFSGQIDPHRNECIYYLEKISSNFNCLINKTPSFGKGFNLNDYYGHLQNSKIAIVPRGVCVPESFRYFEAVKSGCIVISSYPIKDNNFKIWYYENSNVQFIDSWSELSVEFVEKLLDKNNLDRFDELNKEYFYQKISPKAIANYIDSILKKKR